MADMSEKEVAGLVTLALTAVALNGHLIAKLVQVGVISPEHADDIFAKTAESIEHPLGCKQNEEPKATTILRQFAQSVRDMAKASRAE